MSAVLERIEDAYYDNVPVPIVIGLSYLWNILLIIGTFVLVVIGAFTLAWMLGFLHPPEISRSEVLLMAPGGAAPTISVPVVAGGAVAVANYGAAPISVTTPTGSDNAGMARVVDPGTQIVFRVTKP